MTGQLVVTPGQIHNALIITVMISWCDDDEGVAI